MIVFKPDKKIRKKYSLDYKVLSVVYSLIYSSLGGKKNYVVLLRSVKGVFSYYAEQRSKKIVRINISDELRSMPVFHATLAHEFRHFIQDRVYKLPWTKKNYDDSTVNKYLNSPTEIDAGHFDRTMTKKIIRLYGRMKRFKDMLVIKGRYLSDK